MKTQHIGLAIALLVSTSFVSIAQTTGQKIGENPTTKHPGAVLDLESTDKGVLFPRVALSNTTTWGLAGTQTKGMLIYNTKTTTDGFSGTTAYPVATGDGTGLYFWDGTGWAATAKTSGSDPTTDAWIDDPTNTQVKLGTLSNGTTARTDDKAFVAKDNGNVGIGLTNPAGILDIKGKMYVNNKQTIYNADALDNTNLTGSLFIGNGGTKLTTPDAQKGKYNSSLGIDALFENTSGFENTAIGAWALKMNKDGFDNTAIGTVSMRDNISGDHNTALGQSALKMLTTGDHNTALGSNAMLGGTTAITGGLNTAVGYQAMSKLTSGTQNTVLGSAPEAIANNRITTGSDNTFVGYNTGVGITTGGKNTIVGAKVAGLPAALNNNIILADGDGNQRIRVLDNGNTGIGETAPSAKLEVNGNVEIQDVAQVLNDNNYAPLVWNTTTKRIESAISENIKKTVVSLSAGNTATSFYTLQDNFAGAYEIKVYSNNACGQAFYNKFFIAGSNSNSTWSINYVGGVAAGGGSTSAAATPSAARISQNSIKVTNEKIACTGAGGTTAFTFTLSVNQSTGGLSIQNNGDTPRDYHVSIEKAFN